jgi:hypothetical protein
MTTEILGRLRDISLCDRERKKYRDQEEGRKLLQY